LNPSSLSGFGRCPGIAFGTQFIYGSYCKRYIHGSSRFSTKIPSSGDKDDPFGTFEDNNEFMEDLQMRIKKLQIFGPGMEDKPKPNDVFIILFQPDTDNEGVHTIEFPKNSGQNVILAFESLTECQLFSDTLRNQLFYKPEPTEILLQDLEEYCDPLGVEVQVVPRGTSITPPSDVVDNLDYDPNFTLAKDALEDIFQLESQPDERYDPFTSYDIYFSDDDDIGSWQ